MSQCGGGVHCDVVRWEMTVLSSTQLDWTVRRRLWQLRLPSVTQKRSSSASQELGGLRAEEGAGAPLLMTVLAGTALEAGGSLDQQPLAQYQAQQGQPEPPERPAAQFLISAASRSLGLGRSLACPEATPWPEVRDSVIPDTISAQFAERGWGK